VAGASLVTHCSAFDNSLDAIAAGEKSLVANCVTVNNAGHGISATDALIRANMTALNTQGDIDAVGSSVIDNHP
jgi:hypothetical protein